MRDLYEVLGVERDASSMAIKQAYRLKSKELHPDKGGTDEAMAELSSAYQVLSDPKKRAYYDETGKVEGVKQNEQSQFIVFLHSVVKAIIEKTSERDIETNNMVEIFEDCANSTLDQIKKQTKELRSKLKKLQQISKRLKLDDEKNSGMMKEYFLAQIKSIEDLVSDQENEKSKIDEIMLVLKNLSYETDEASTDLEDSFGFINEMLKKERGQRRPSFDEEYFNRPWTNNNSNL